VKDSSELIKITTMYLFIYLLIYFLLVFVIRSLLQWRKTGVNPLTFNKGDDAHGFNGKVFVFILIIEFIVVGIYTFKHNWYEFLLPFWYLENAILIKIGWGLLLLSLLIVWIAQSQMADSWRIGIDTKHKTDLVTSGLFSFSRNPVFLGIMIANFGLFLVLPNAFTLMIIALSFVSINTQIRLEEDFLKKDFGDEYQEYRQKVRRWI
jgi:protein-S-isoprenylcysteine O-methyltransferase Ste14